MVMVMVMVIVISTTTMMTQKKNTVTRTFEELQFWCLCRNMWRFSFGRGILFAKFVQSKIWGWSSMWINKGVNLISLQFVIPFFFSQDFTSEKNMGLRTKWSFYVCYQRPIVDTDDYRAAVSNCCHSHCCCTSLTAYYHHRAHLINHIYYHHQICSHHRPHHFSNMFR
jgi:hypothetical protein